jgi:T5orf172 domain
VTRPTIKYRKLPYLHRFRDRHGELRIYFRKKGFPSVTLPPAGTPEFELAYQAALAEHGIEPHVTPPRASIPMRHPRAPQRGYVYFLRRADSIKIGWSANPFARGAQLQTGSSERPESIVALRATQHQENLLHRRFGKHRHNGEWFKAAPEIIEFVARSVKLGRLAFELMECQTQKSVSDPFLSNREISA